LGEGVIDAAIHDMDHPYLEAEFSIRLGENFNQGLEFRINHGMQHGFTVRKVM
jgi:hypothetical protein